MKLIIDIPDEEYKQLKDYPNVWNSHFERIIANGTPLPTGHGDLIDRSALEKEFDKECVGDCSTCIHSRFDNYEGLYKCSLIDNAPTVPERDYSQGWHDAITKALNEAYTITTEDGSFKVVQTETLEGLGMSMPDKKGECCGSCYLCDVGDCGADMKGGA